MWHLHAAQQVEQSIMLTTVAPPVLSMHEIPLSTCLHATQAGTMQAFQAGSAILNRSQPAAVCTQIPETPNLSLTHSHAYSCSCMGAPVRVSMCLSRCLACPDPAALPAAVMDQMTRIVGRPALQPFWSLGFHNCKYALPSCVAFDLMLCMLCRPGMCSPCLAFSKARAGEGFRA